MSLPKQQTVPIKSVYKLSDEPPQAIRSTPSKANHAKMAYGIMMKNRTDYYHFISESNNTAAKSRVNSLDLKKAHHVTASFNIEKPK